MGKLLCPKEFATGPVRGRSLAQTPDILFPIVHNISQFKLCIIPPGGLIRTIPVLLLVAVTSHPTSFSVI